MGADPEPGVVEALRGLVEAAILAPSGDNTQPWRFEIDPARRRIRLEVDPTRDASPMNAGQRMARIAVGAALENLLQAAEHNGWRMRFKLDAEGAEVFLESGEIHAVAVPPEITNRCTNRRIYEGTEPSEAALQSLRRDVVTGPQTAVEWIVDRDRMQRLGALIAKADAALFGDAAMRRAFFANVRFDQAPLAAVDEGLSLGSLELGTVERMAFRIMRKLPDALLNSVGIGSSFAARTPSMIKSSSGLCFVIARDDTPQTDIEVGRVMEAAWLKLTDLGFAAQPMMSFPVIENTAGNSTYGEQVDLAKLKEVSDDLSREFRSQTAVRSGERIGFILRFGKSLPPLARTARRSGELPHER